jgi:hypothetical protein
MIKFEKNTNRFPLPIEWEKAVEIVKTAVNNGTFLLPDKEEDYGAAKWQIACFVSALYTGLSNPEELEMAEFYQTGAWIAKCQIGEQLYGDWQSDKFMDAVYEK